MLANGGQAALSCPSGLISLSVGLDANTVA